MSLGFLDTIQVPTALTRARRRPWLSVSVAILLAALLSLVFGAISLTSAMASVEKSTAERSILNGRLRDLLALTIQLNDAETGQRGYLLTGKREYLAPYEQAVAQIPAATAQTLSAFDSDPEHFTRIQRLQPLIDAKLSELRETIDLYNAGRKTQAIAIVMSDTGRAYMDQIRALLGDTVNELRLQRDAADSRVVMSTIATKRWAMITIAALIFALALVGYQLRGLARSRDRYEAELAHRTTILNAIVDDIPTMVAVWDRDLKYRFVNKSFEQWRGKRRTDVIGKTIEGIAGKEEYERSLPWLQRALQGEVVRFEKEYPEGSVKHLAATYSPLINDDGEIFGVVALGLDITDQRREQVRLRQLSETDSLTGLLNRLGFEVYLKEHVDAGLSESLALIFLDLDEFKPVNDTYGHAAGDAVLKTVAKRLRNSVRPTDAVARLGGDEFAIVLPHIRQLVDVQRIAEKVTDEIRKPIEWEGKSLSIRASLGTAFNIGKFGGWRALMAHADSMLYVAKSSRAWAAPNASRNR